MNTALDAKKAVQSAIGIVTVDGKIGPKTLAGLNKLVGTDDSAPWPPVAAQTPQALEPPPVVDNGEKVDARSEKAIATLHPKVQPVARKFIQQANAKLAARGMIAVITSATRTYAEQNDLYEQGRSKPGKIVTNARGGYSNHNFGIAFDVTTFKSGQPVWDGQQYLDIGPIGEALGFTWGHRWASIDDQPHYELHPPWAKNMSESAMLAELRRRHESGEDAFA